MTVAFSLSLFFLASLHSIAIDRDVYYKEDNGGVVVKVHCVLDCG